MSEAEDRVQRMLERAEEIVARKDDEIRTYQSALRHRQEGQISEGRSHDNTSDSPGRQGQGEHYTDTGDIDHV